MKVKLFQRNEYKIPRLFSERKFDEDVEGQNFYITEASDTAKSIMVYPTSKVKFDGFPVEQTSQSSGTENKFLNFLSRLANTFFMSGNLLFYTRYSRILFEGD